MGYFAKNNSGRLALLMTGWIILCPDAARSDIMMSGGLNIDKMSYSETVPREQIAGQARPDEKISGLNTGIWGGFSLGFEPNSFGFHSAAAVTFLGGADSKIHGPLSIVEMVMRTQMTYNLPAQYPFSWAKRGKVKEIFENIHPWVGFGPVLIRSLSKTNSAGEQIELVPDLMDFGIGTTIGFHINFWKKYTRSGKFMEKMMGMSYAMIDFTYVFILTPDDENTAADNASKTRRGDFIVRLGSGIRFDTSPKKEKTIPVLRPPSGPGEKK